MFRVVVSLGLALLRLRLQPQQAAEQLVGCCSTVIIFGPYFQVKNVRAAKFAIFPKNI